MLLSRSAPSSSSSALNEGANEYKQLTDILERRLSETLSLHVRETIRVAFIAEAATWSAQLSSSLHRMEQEFTSKLKIKSAPLVASDGSVDGARMESPSSSYLPRVWEESGDPSFAVGGAHAEQVSSISSDGDEERGTAKCSSIASRTPPLWRTNTHSNPPCRGLQARRPSEPTVESIASIEQRLANGIFRAKLGNGSSESNEASVLGRSGHRIEPDLAVNLGRSVSFSSSVYPSVGTVDSPVSRSSSLEAPEMATRGEQGMIGKASCSSRPSTFLLSMGSLQTQQWSLATSRFYQGEITDLELSSTPTRLSVKCLPRLLGVLPWSPRCKYFSILYQVFVVLVSFCLTVKIILGSIGRDVGENQDLLPVCFGIVLALGGFSGLCACLIRNRSIVAATMLIESYAGRADVCNTWDERSLKDTCFILCLFALCICLEYLPNWTGGRVELDFATVFVELLLLALCSQVLRFIRFLRICVEVYCNYVMESKDFAAAVQEWYLLHATCRTVCESIQLCFVILQSVAVGVLLLIFMSGEIQLIPENLLLPHILPGVLCAIMVATLSARASSFSHNCDRVPILINAASFADMDADRMYLVDYILKSKTGFYIFNVKLSSGIVLKTFYIAGAAAFTFASHALLNEF